MEETKEWIELPYSQGDLLPALIWRPDRDWDAPIRLSREFVREKFGRVPAANGGWDYVPYRIDRLRFDPTPEEAKGIAGLFEAKRAEAVRAMEESMRLLKSGADTLDRRIRHVWAEIAVSPGRVREYLGSGDPTALIESKATAMTDWLEDPEEARAYMLSFLRRELRLARRGKRMFASWTTNGGSIEAKSAERCGIRLPKEAAAKADLPDAAAAYSAVMGAAGDYFEAVSVIDREVLAPWWAPLWAKHWLEETRIPGRMVDGSGESAPLRAAPETMGGKAKQ